MQQEFETKVLEINVVEIINKLGEIWAILKQPETLMKRWVFDTKEDKKGYGKWFRLRQQGDITTLTYKDRNGTEIWATKEIETTVWSFEDMAEILQKLERRGKFYQENKRTMYVLDRVEICIDSRPKIPTYLEIEWPSTESVQDVVKKLWLEWKDLWDIWVLEIYEKYGLNLHSFKELKFEEQD